MKHASSNRKNLVLAAALASLVGTVTLNPKVSFAGDHDKHAKTEKKGDAKCADGSCGDKKDKKKKKADAKCADGSCGDKKDKKKKKGDAKCADGSCGDKGE